jgi:hypothetical protein
LSRARQKVFIASAGDFAVGAWGNEFDKLTRQICYALENRFLEIPQGRAMMV